MLLSLGATALPQTHSVHLVVSSLYIISIIVADKHLVLIPSSAGHLGSLA